MNFLNMYTIFDIVHRDQTRKSRDCLSEFIILLTLTSIIIGCKIIFLKTYFEIKASTKEGSWRRREFCSSKWPVRSYSNDLSGWESLGQCGQCRHTRKCWSGIFVVNFEQLFVYREYSCKGKIQWNTWAASDIGRCLQWRVFQKNNVESDFIKVVKLIFKVNISYAKEASIIKWSRDLSKRFWCPVDGTKNSIF